MTDHTAHSCRLEKLRSGVYELSWILRSKDCSECTKSFFKTKTQLMEMANDAKTPSELRAFLKGHFLSGAVIKMTQPDTSISGDVKPWMKQPGECFDKTGCPIYPGDLLKTLHFVTGKSTKHYHYHVAVYKDKCMRLFTPAMADPNCRSGAVLDCLMRQDLVNESEILEGSGPGDFYTFEQRTRNKI